jgi:Uma2 family endonuclease
MQAAPKPRPFTYRHYTLLPEDGRQWELIDGEFYVSPAPTPWHQTVSRRIQYALMTMLEEAGIAEVFDAPVDLLLHDTTCVQPDLVVVRCRRAHLVTRRAIEGTPDLVVEILSPSTRDRDLELKREVYEKFSVPEYWIVDPEEAAIDQHVLDPQRLTLRRRWTGAQTLDSPGFPEIRLDLARVFGPRPA